MNIPLTLLAILVFCVLAYLLAFRRARHKPQTELQSLPRYYGYLAALWAGLPALLLLCVWLALEPRLLDRELLANLPEHIRAQTVERQGLVLNDIKLKIESGQFEGDPAIEKAIEVYRRHRQQSSLLLMALVAVLGFSALAFASSRALLRRHARIGVERVMRLLLMASSGIAIATTVGIVLSVLFESLRFFQAVPLFDFMFGLEWSPQTAIRADQVGSSGSFGAVPLFVGTMLISAIALLIAVPVGLMSAIYLSEYASRRLRNFAKPMLEILAGIPTVVYGFFAALTVAPLVRNLGQSIGLDVSSESALAAGVVMGVMIIPFVSSLSDDVINAVPQALRDGSLALGATPSETVRQVIIPAALPGIVGGVLLAASRAIGETMIVVMAAGLAARLTINPLEAVTTVTVQIVTLLTGDQEFDSPKTLAAFALGLMLFVTTLLLNVLALRVVRKYREHYE